MGSSPSGAVVEVASRFRGVPLLRPLTLAQSGECAGVVGGEDLTGESSTLGGVSPRSSCKGLGSRGPETVEGGLADLLMTFLGGERLGAGVLTCLLLDELSGLVFLLLSRLRERELSS